MFFPVEYPDRLRKKTCVFGFFCWVAREYRHRTGSFRGSKKYTGRAFLERFIEERVDALKLIVDKHGANENVQCIVGISVNGGILRDFFLPAKLLHQYGVGLITLHLFQNTKRK